MSRPGLPRMRREAALARVTLLERALREPTGDRHLPPTWKHWEAPSEGRVGHGHQMLLQGAGTSGRLGGWGLGNAQNLSNQPCSEITQHRAVRNLFKKLAVNLPPRSLEEKLEL